MKKENNLIDQENKTVAEEVCTANEATESCGKLPISDMTQEYWEHSVNSAAATVSGSNSEQRDQFREKMKLALEAYDWAYLICALEDWGGGYRSGWAYRSSTANLKSHAVHDGEHFYQAWVIGKDCN
ncbi:MAG: hypothetical protein ACEPOZ_10125 [Marinifilaceae bacterium]